MKNFKRLILINLIVTIILTLFIGVTGATCDPAPTPNDDNITCTGVVLIDSLYADATVNGVGSGNDVIIVSDSASVTTIFSDSQFGAGSGNDIIIVSDSASVTTIFGDSQFGAGSGNDVIIVSDSASVTYLKGDSTYRAGSGNDVIIVSDSASVTSLQGDSFTDVGSGNDIIIVSDSASVTFIYGDSAWQAGSGNDIITVSDSASVGIIYGDSAIRDGSGSGNDIITVSDSASVGIIYGDSEEQDGSGNDTIVVEGQVGSIYSDTEFGNGTGDDTIIITGTVTGEIQTSGGNDYVFVGGTVVGVIDGGADYDILEILGGTVCAGQGMPEGISEFLNADPAGDSVSVRGNVYTWTNFEELRAIIEVYFCDGRNEAYDMATPLVSYCNIFGGLDIFDVNEIGVDDRGTEGILTMRSTHDQLVEILALAVSTGENQLISTDEYGNSFWALSSRELQIMGPEVNEPSTTYTVIFDPAICGL